VLLGVAGCIYRALRAQPDRRIYGLAMTAGLFLILPSVIYSPTGSQYLYIPSAFFAVFLVRLMGKMPSLRMRVLVGYTILIQVPGIWFSPSLRSLRRTGEDVEALVYLLKEWSEYLPTGATIGILEHPHVAAEPHNWAYRQLIFDVFFPDEEWVYLSDDASSRADHRFWWESEKSLLLIPKRNPKR